MTRLASVIVGVAVVATMVRLSGCPQPATDYAEVLVGTWTVSLKATVPNPAAPTTPIEVDSDVTVEIASSEKNAGTIELTVENYFPPSPVPVKTVGSGSFTVDATVITATLDEISEPVPQNVRDLKGVEQRITWKISGNMLTVTSKPLFEPLGVPESFTLEKKP